MAIAAVARWLGGGSEPEEEDDMTNVLSYLKQHLGAGVTAYVSGAEDPGVVEKWLAGAEQLDASQEFRLRRAYDAARCVVEAYDDETAMQWFFGMNPSLADAAPAYVLRHGSQNDWEVVLPAALEFAETAR
jgi:hypothetical protein